MNRQHCYSILIGFFLAVLVADSIAEYRTLALVLSCLTILVLSIELYISNRRKKWAAFQKTIDAYVARHDVDLSQSGAHLF